MQALSDAKAGENYTIKWMFGLPEVLDLLCRVLRKMRPIIER